MPRRGHESRRLAKRRLYESVWWVFGVFLLAGLILFVFQHQQQQERLEPHILDSIADESIEKFDFKQELLSSTSLARQLSDQMTLAKAYLVIAKEHHNLQFAHELSSSIRACQLLLSRSITRGKTLTVEESAPTITRLSNLIYKAQDSHYDLSTTIVTLRSHIQALADRATSALVQSAHLGQAISSGSVPRILHCLNIKLTEEWSVDPFHGNLAAWHSTTPRLTDNNLYHFCMFSENILAASAVINSTVSSADHPKQLVFHVVTDRINFRAMKAWFVLNEYKGSTIEVRSLEEISNRLNLSNLLNYRVNLENLRFFIPEFFPHLEKVVFLEDDISVQKDLTALFSIELHGNVIGAVETCLDSAHRLHSYINFSNPLIGSGFDPQSCGWAFGLNVFDLVRWKRENLMARYQYWYRKNSDHAIFRAGPLPIGLLVFYGLVEPLDRRWHVLGLGFDSEIDERLIESAAVLHYNGYLKPWLGLGFERYKHLWEQYVDFTNPYIKDCMAF